MRHKWRETKKSIETRSRLIVPFKQYECVNCGLRKGYDTNRHFYSSYPNILYFDENEVYSEGKLPFKCGEFQSEDMRRRTLKRVLREIQDYEFIEEKEFLI